MLYPPPSPEGRRRIPPAEKIRRMHGIQYSPSGTGKIPGWPRNSRLKRGPKRVFGVLGCTKRGRRNFECLFKFPDNVILKP
jgi:hypothetical protein